MRASRRIASALAASLALASAPAFALTYSTTNIAVSSAPGQWPGASAPFVFFNAPILDSAGNVVFSGNLANGHYITAAQYGPNRIVLLEQLNNSLDPCSAAPGAIALLGIDDTSSQFQLRISTGQPANSTPFATVGSPAHDAFGNPTLGNYTSLAVPPVTNSPGNIAFFGSYSAANTNAVWYRTPAGVVLRTDTSSLIANGAAVTYIGSIRMSDSGVIALNGFAAAFADHSHDGIWTLPLAASPVRLAQYGDAVPGGTITALNTPAINNAAHVVFIASTSAGDSRLFDYDSSLHEVLRTGSLIPSIGSLSFSTLSNPLINHDDRIAFDATLTLGGAVTTSSDEVIAITGPTASGLTLVAREGNSLASLGLPSVSLQAPDAFTPEFGSSLGLNASGDVLFQAFLHDSASPRAGDSGIFVWDASDSSLHLIARVGDSLPAAPGLSIAQLYLNSNSGGEDGYTSAFNDAAQVAFTAAFDDASTVGVYLASPVPEPTSLALLSAAAFALTLRRRR